MTRKICVITGTRAEYGLLYWTMKGIQADPQLELQLCITGTHLSKQYGHTVDAIIEDGFEVDYRVDIKLEEDTPVAIGRSTGLAVTKMSEALSELKPDVVLVVGDRYEILAASMAATIGGVPIAHCHGGEATLGAMDDSFRHAITKLSHIHFVATEEYKRRVIQMGEAPGRVHFVGGLGIENIRKMKLLSRVELKQAGVTLGAETILATYHPETNDADKGKRTVKELIRALEKVEGDVIITMPNADVGSSAVIEMLEVFAGDQPDRVQLFASLGQQRYLSVMKLCDVVVGNSSSGIIEAPSLGRPTVNIGQRQEGRVKADSIIACDATESEITSAIRKALSPEFRKIASECVNPYDHGDASEQIVRVLSTIDLTDITKKKFHDLS